MERFSKIMEDYRKELDYKNVLDVMENIDNYEPKIQKYIEKYSKLYNEDAVDLLKIKASKDFDIATIFAKDTTRQNSSENIIWELLVKHYGDAIIRNPSGGKDSIRFNEFGNIVKDGKKGNNNTKSVDFTLKINNEVWYITQKYTRDEGGAQDNQFKDVIDFLNKGSIKNNVIALVDGEYWYKRLPKLKEDFEEFPNVKIVELRELFTTFS